MKKWTYCELLFGDDKTATIVDNFDIDDELYEKAMSYVDKGERIPGEIRAEIERQCSEQCDLEDYLLDDEPIEDDFDSEEAYHFLK